MRIGHGYDVHRLVSGRALILGGVTIPYEKGLDGHSDADVLVHAVMDALLGAAAMGDIGKLFPDNDDRYLGADSMELLREVSRRLEEAGYRLGNLDATIIAQRPKLAPYIAQMRQNLADALRTGIGKAQLPQQRQGRLLIKDTAQRKAEITPPVPLFQQPVLLKHGGEPPPLQVPDRAAVRPLQPQQDPQQRSCPPRRGP